MGNVGITRQNLTNSGHSLRTTSWIIMKSGGQSHIYYTVPLLASDKMYPLLSHRSSISITESCGHISLSPSVSTHIREVSHMP